MATSIGNDISSQDLHPSHASARTAANDLLVCLAPMARVTRDAVVSVVTAAFPDASLLIAVTDAESQGSSAPQTNFVTYDEARSHTGWALHAVDYLAAGNLARKQQKKHVILLGSDAPSAALLQSLAQDVLQGHADVVMPRLRTGPNDGLVNSAMLYPMTRALFGQDIRFPLPHNIALSQRASERFAAEAQREVTAGRCDSLLWPVSIASTAGFSIRQVETDEHVPALQVADFNRLFTEVIGSLLADAESKAITWQRGRYLASARQGAPAAKVAVGDAPADVVSMIEGFRVAYANLLPIWSLVLPPQSLLALKKLSQVPPQTFTFPPELWARIVYDFALAFHLRTINRNHLLGALTPLYLAWVASHILSAASDVTTADQQVQDTAAAFESEKPYFVSRWRWPDRFNP